MPRLYPAHASPEKNLFISLITRDITLADAIIDLLDNSVNAAMRPIRNNFSSASDFYKIFSQNDLTPAVVIRVVFDKDRVRVEDNALGIAFSTAENEVLRFGHSSEHHESRDRLSVYGIGMKRALFKIGKRISITSDHSSGGFGLSLNVNKWARSPKLPWTIPISKRAPSKNTGTKIQITHLNPEIRERLGDKTFSKGLIDKISKVYSFFIGRIVEVYVNGERVARTDFEIGHENYSHDKFKKQGVDCSILAGIASQSSKGSFVSTTSGWFVFCNYRTVIYGDKSMLTGWGGDLPQFQPKHRPFLGIVLLTSSDPEALPWTTTKGQIDEDNGVWQEARLRMASVGRPVISFLDKRYSDDGTTILPSGIAKSAGPGVNVFEIATSAKATFVPPSGQPKKKKEKTTQRVQYDAEKTELAAIRRHFGRANMSASDIGRTTFDHFLKNEVGDA